MQHIFGIVVASCYPAPEYESDQNAGLREVIHRSFEDPAQSSGSEEEQLKVFRQVRDKIREWIIHTFE